MVLSSSQTTNQKDFPATQLSNVFLEARFFKSHFPFGNLEKCGEELRRIKAPHFLSISSPGLNDALISILKFQLQLNIFGDKNFPRFSNKLSCIFPIDPKIKFPFSSDGIDLMARRGWMQALRIYGSASIPKSQSKISKHSIFQ